MTLNRTLSTLTLAVATMMTPVVASASDTITPGPVSKVVSTPTAPQSTMPDQESGEREHLARILAQRQATQAAVREAANEAANAPTNHGANASGANETCDSCAAEAPFRSPFLVTVPPGAYVSTPGGFNASSPEQMRAGVLADCNRWGYTHADITARFLNPQGVAAYVCYNADQ